MKTAVNPQTGERIMWDGSAWVPMTETGQQSDPISAPAESSGFDWQGALNTFARGASFGTVDEAAGLASAGVNALSRVANANLRGDSLIDKARDALRIAGDGFRQDYDFTRDDFNRRHESFAEANPVTAAGVELVGGLASGIPAAKALTALQRIRGASQLVSRAPQWVKMAGAGAAPGALYGAGAAEEGERLEGAAVGGTIGGVTGVLAPAALRMAGRGARRVGEAGQTAFRHLTEPGSAATDRASKKIAQSIARDDMTPELVQAKMRRLGPDAMLVDAGGENLLDVANSITSMPGRAKNVGKRALENRAKGAQRRIVGAITKTLGLNDVDFDKATLALHDNMRRIASEEGYDDILNAGIVRMDDELKKMAQGTTMKRALAQAYSILDDDIALGRADAKLRDFFTFTNPRTGQTMEVPALVAQFSDDTLKPAGARFDPANYSKASEPTLRVWDYVKRGLDAVISDGADPVTGKLSSQAERAAAFKRNLMSKLDDAAPDYARVRGMYADEKSAESAMNLGRKFIRDDAEVTARRIADMSEAEKHFFRLGAGRALYDRVMSSMDTGMGWRSIAKTPLVREKIAQIFPDKKARDQYIRALERELKFAETNAVANPAANSASARRLYAQADMAVAPELVDAGAAAADVAQGRLGAALMKGLRTVNNRFGSGIPDPVRNQLADALFSGDPQVVQQLMGRIQSAPQFRQPLPPPSAAQGFNAGLMGEILLNR